MGKISFVKMKVFQIRNRRSKLRKSQHLADRGNWSDPVLPKLVKIGGDFFVAGAGRVFFGSRRVFCCFLQLERFCDQIWQVDNSHDLATRVPRNWQKRQERGSDGWCGQNRQ